MRRWSIFWLIESKKYKMIPSDEITKRPSTIKREDINKELSIFWTRFTGAHYLQYMLFALKSMSMNTLMWWEKFFHRITFFADEKSMILIWFTTLASTPFSEGRDVVYEFLPPEKLKHSVDCDGIDWESFSYFVGGKSTMIFLEKTEYFLSCFCLSHKRQCSDKIVNATLLHCIRIYFAYKIYLTDIYL